MPYWQRQHELNRSLAAYRAVYPDVDIEFSICDDGSSVPVHAPGCVVTTLPRKDCALNPCVPINVAVRASTSDVIVLTNPEIEHREPVLQDMLAALQGPDDYVTASCYEEDRGIWLAGPRTVYGTSGREPVPPGSHFHFCAMFRRELFERAGGFDEDYRFGQGCDDNDWLFRLAAAGANFKHVDKTVYHHRTVHAWTGTTKQNAALLRKKWLSSESL
ncbi:MAG: glycosyltransferase family 2 protein [Steroidobacteraceae bacterium]